MMSTATKQLPPPVTDEERMERYGYREIRRDLPNGKIEFDRVALTLEDLLHPQMGDVAMLSSRHCLETHYLFSVLRSRLVDDPHALVLQDTGVFWDAPPLRHHSPDISVIFDIREQKQNWITFHVAEEGTRPTILIEVVSPDYRNNDVVTKVSHYHLARVPFYYIVDRENSDDPPSLIGYRWTPEEYVAITPGADGRFWLGAVSLWLGVEDGKVACFDGETGKRLGDYTEVCAELVEMSERAEAEARRAEAEARRAEAEARRAEVEARRADAEAQRAETEHRQRLAVEAELNSLKQKLLKTQGQG